MYVSLNHKFLFYRIPKTASTAMVQALDPYLLKFSKQLGYVNLHHTPSESLKILNDIQIPISKNFKMIMVIRNPYARIISIYNYAKEGLVPRNIQSFDCFLDMLDARNKKDPEALKLLKSRLYDTQLNWTLDPNAFNIHIFKYEVLDPIEIANCLGIPTLTLTRENTNTIPSEQYELESYQKEKIYSMYEEEFNLYSYRK